MGSSCAAGFDRYWTELRAGTSRIIFGDWAHIAKSETGWQSPGRYYQKSSQQP